MKQTLGKNLIFLMMTMMLVLSGNVFAQPTQNPPTKQRNSPFSPNPKKKEVSTEKTTKSEAEPVVENTTSEVTNEQKTEETTKSENTEIGTSIAQKTLEIAKRSRVSNKLPTEIYRIGAGDILDIRLRNNAQSKESTLFTVFKDGTIDYPLAGGSVEVVGLTEEEIEEVIRQRVKLYENPDVTVKVREHQSHTITVLGMVEKRGLMALQREAVPLYVVRATVFADSKVNLAIIKRASTQQEERIDLKEYEKYKDVLVYPNDIVEFDAVTKTASANQAQFYFVAGNVVSPGQKNFHEGITLTQAIFAAGGLKKNNAKKVVIRRKNEEGLLVPTIIDLKSIKDGKAPDVVILAGDIIEVES